MIAVTTISFVWKSSLNLFLAMSFSSLIAPQLPASSQPSRHLLAQAQSTQLDRSEMNKLYQRGLELRGKKAIESFQQGLIIAKKLKDQKQQVEFSAKIAGIYDALGDYKRQSQFLEEVRTICQNLFANRLNRETYFKYQLCLSNQDDSTDLAFSYIRSQQYNKAVNHYLEDLHLQKLHYHGANAGMAKRLGNVYQIIGNIKKAIEYYQIAIEGEKKNIARGYFKINTERGGSALFNLASAYLGIDKLKEAEKILISSIEAYENQNPPLPTRSSIGSTELGSGNDSYPFFVGQIRPYALLQKIFVRQNKLASALEVSDRIRFRFAVTTLFGRINFPRMFQSGGKDANGLLLSYEESQMLGRMIAKDPINIQQIKQIAKEQNAILVEYSLIHDDKAFLRAEAKIADIYIWVVKPNGEITFRRANFKPIQADKNNSLEKLVNTTIQSVIGARSSNDASLLSFAAGEFVKLKDDVPNWEPWQVIAFNPQYKTLTLKLSSWGDTNQTIDRPIADVAEKVKSNRINEVNLQLLHQVLITPIADLLPTDPNTEVVFIPHGDLFLVPFAALQDSNGKYLIEKHTIRNSPSIHLLKLTRQQHQRIAGKVNGSLVVGNPKFSKTPITWQLTLLLLAQLPHAEEEVQNIAQLLKTKVVTGEQATKAFTLSQMPNARIIHLATHGLLGNFGSGSALALAPSGKDNGLLTESEILNLNLSAELVVMSACNTAQGTILGDGVIGLARSFIAAGVPSVVATLWAIPDAPTAELMTDFYRNLQKGQNKAQALRQAMLNTMKIHPAPRDWAAFTLIGEAE